MADSPLPLGKTILQLDPHTGEIDLEKSYMELHVVGQLSSKKIPLSEIVASGKSAYEVAVENGYRGTQTEWLNSLVGLKGDKGDQGVKGADGKSAYETAKENGFSGNEAAWIISLTGPKGDKGDVGAKGETGDKGDKGDAGVDGADGADGKSAFDLAKDAGFEGTQEEWVASLKGDKGDQGDKGADGADGQRGADGEQGIPGKSAYEVALDNGFDGGPEDPTNWLESLKGADGLSSYEIAVNEGFVGTEAEWLESLRGAKGADGLPGADGKNSVLGNLVGVLGSPEELPDVVDFLNGDYFFIGKNVYMNLNGEWTDLGDFSGIPGVDGTGITVMGELANVGLLPPGGGRNGDCWLIGKSMWVWNGTRWQEQGQQGAKGDKGDKGDIGPEGKSAFEVVKAQYPEIDTVDKYVEHIRGLKGDKGDIGLSFISDGTKATTDELPEAHVEGHGFLVGSEETGFDFWVYTAGNWVNLGRNVGPKGDQGDKGDTGAQGPRGHSTTPKGTLATVDELPVDNNTIGDTYNINGVQHSWDGTVWKNMGDLTGPQGEQGVAGDMGPAGPALIAKGSLDSVEQLTDIPDAQPGWAYEILGRIYVFSEDAFVDMGAWKGIDGKDGKDGAKGADGSNGADGEAGKDGAAGKSNYQIAVDNGFVGTEAEWLLTITGPKGDKGEAGTNGKDGVDGAKGDKGDVGEPGEPGAKGDQGEGLKFKGDFTGSELPVGVNADTVTKDGRFYAHDGSTWVDIGAVGSKGEKGEVGAQGESAFDAAVGAGFQGDKTAWLASLKGDKGEVGKSLYQDAVDRGLFSGTLEQFIASQKGDTGASTLELAIAEGLLSEGANAQDLINLTTGPQGPEGEQGIQGDTGPAISIIGTVENEAALPVSGVVGTGYAVPDPATPGVFDCWIWLEGTGWFNLGHVVGAQGPKGDQGVRGLQGPKGSNGEKGDRGSIWIVFDRDPDPLDGRVDDYFFNKNTQEFWRKIDIATWASLGHIGGGNLNAPSANGSTKGFKDSAWVDLPLLDTIPTDTGTYVLKNGVWTRFDTYTLAARPVAIVSGKAAVDLSVARVFRISNTAAATVEIKNLPEADRATTFLVKVYGKVGAFNWTLPTGSIRWFDGAAPTFANDITTVVLTWDGQEMTGAVPN